MTRSLARSFGAALLLLLMASLGPGMAQDKPSSLALRSGLPENFDQEFSHRFAKPDAVRLHYVIGGPAEGPMVVLLHGWPQTWYTWRRVMPALAAAGYRVVAVDYRGAGDSDKPPGG